MFLFSSRTRLAVVSLFSLSAIVGLASFGGRIEAELESAFFVPSVTATKSATLVTDVNGNGFVNPGDTLMYSVVVSNSGTDAMNVVFTDQLNANLTQSGIATASPIATNDAFTSIGNVGVTVPAGSGLLANDISPDNTSVSVTSVNTAGTQGTVTFNPNGSFTFMPAAGFEGSTTFGYTLTSSNGKTDTGTVTITVSGMIWFVDNNAPACTTIAGGCGRWNNPFSSLAAFNTANVGGGSNPDNNDNIFVYESGTQYTGAVTLRTGQKLIGQDATATLATITGISVPTFSNALPAMNSGNGTITNLGNTVTINTNTTVRGLSINSTTTTGMNDPAGAITGVSVSEVNVTTTTATDVLLSDVGGSLSFISIARNGGTVNAISLTNVSATFTVTGTGSAGSGGTIQNIVGGDAVNLNTTSGLVSLNYMIIQDITASTDAADALQTHSGVDAIHGRAVSGGLTLTNSTIQRISDNAINGTVDGVPVTNNPTNTTWSGLTLTGNTIQNTNRFNVASRGDATNESAIIIWGISGTVSVTNNTIQNCSSGIDFVTHTSGTLDMTVQSNTFNTLYKEIGTSSVGRFGISVVQEGTLTSTVRVGDWQNETNPALGNTFTNAGNLVGIRVISNTTAMGNLKALIAQNTFTVTDHSSPGQPPLNTIYNFPQSGVLLRHVGNVAFPGGGNFESIVAANTFNECMHADGGLGNVSVIMEKGDAETIIRNNTFNKPWDLPMELRSDGSSNTQASSKIQVTGNSHIDGIVGDGTTDLGGQSPYGSSYVQVRNNGRMDLTMQNEATPLGLTDTSSTTGTVSLFTQTTTAGDILNIFLQNLQGPRGYRLKHDGFGTYNLFRNGSGAATAQLVLQANNVLGGGGVDNTSPPTVTATGTITLTNTAPMLPNITPSFAPPVDGGEEQQAAPQQGGGNSASLTTRIGQWLRPVFSAFVAPTNLSLKALGNWFSPAVSAAESEALADTRAADTKPAIPARTMLVNGKGEYVIVPTASLSSAMAGELITINGTGGGFTLPAAESTTIMFNATISSTFTGTAITNQASVSGTGFSPVLSNNLSTPVIQAPTFSKAFSPTSIATNTGVSTLTFTLVNGNPSTALSNVAFNDALPSGVEVAATPAATTSGCGSPTWTPAAAATLLSFSGGSITAGGTCTVSVNVRSTTEGVKANISTPATSTQANPSGTASATLAVINAPTFSKVFGSPTVPLNGTTSLTLTITNNSQFFPLNGVGFTDTLPAGLVVATPSNLSTTCGGTATAARAEVLSVCPAKPGIPPLAAR